MEISEIIRHFELENNEFVDELRLVLNELYQLPHSFFAVNWYASNEFIWISEMAEKVTGHPMDNWKNMGIMFIYSLTPKELIPDITRSLQQGVAPLEEDMTRLNDGVIMHVPGGISNADGDLLSLNCYTLFLDYTPGPEKTYFVLTVYISNGHAAERLGEIKEEAQQLQRRIHELYVKMKPERFRFLKSFFRLTKREVEVSELIRNGYNSKEIGDKLNIATSTAISHRKNILKKLRVRNTAELVQLINRVMH